MMPFEHFVFHMNSIAVTQLLFVVCISLFTHKIWHFKTKVDSKIQLVHKKSCNNSFALYPFKKCTVTPISPPTKLSNLNT